MRDIGVVFRKELLEVTRDKKTLIFMVLLPVLLIPTLLEVTMRVAMTAEKDAATKVLKVSLAGEDSVVARLAPRLEAGGFEVIGATAEDSAKIGDGALDLAVLIAGSGEAHGAAKDARYRVVVRYDNASLTSKALARLTPLLDAAAAELRAERLDALGVREKDAQDVITSPLDVVNEGVAPLREVMGERVGSTLPLILIVFCFLGAMYPAIDLAAGEKERGTLMTLLLVPTPRWQLVLGKLLVVFTTAVIAALLSLIGLGVWLAVQSGALEGALGEVLATIGWVDLSLIGLMLVPTALIFASLLLSISIYAKSFKEAQNYIAPLNLVIIMPAFVATLPGVELDAMTAWIPVTNVALAVDELVKGTMDTALLWPVLGSGFVFGGLALWASTRWFARESVLFRR